MTTRIHDKGTKGVNYCKFGFIVASELKSSAVQRELTPARLKSIPDFNPQLTRPVVIRKNKDGTYRHIEGQLTVQMWIASHKPGIKIPCQIITDKNISDARAFIDLNNTSACNWPDKIRALLVDGDPAALTMNEIVDEVGFSLRTCKGRRARFQFAYGCNPGVWFFFIEHGERKLYSCLEMLSDLFDRPDEEDLEQTAATDMKFWHGLKAVYKRHTAAKIYHAFKKENISSADIIARAKNESDACSNGGLQSMVIKVMLDIVAKHTRKK